MQTGTTLIVHDTRRSDCRRHWECRKTSPAVSLRTCSRPVRNSGDAAILRAAYARVTARSRAGWRPRRCDRTREQRRSGESAVTFLRYNHWDRKVVRMALWARGRAAAPPLLARRSTGHGSSLPARDSRSSSSREFCPQEELQPRWQFQLGLCGTSVLLAASYPIRFRIRNSGENQQSFSMASPSAASKPPVLRAAR